MNEVGRTVGAAAILTPRKGTLTHSEADRIRLEKACREFEALFIEQLLKGMRRTIPSHGSREQAFYTQLFDEQVARACAKRGLGLARMLFSYLESRLQEGEGGEGSQVFPPLSDKILDPNRGIERGSR